YDPAFARRLFSCRNRINSGSRSQAKYRTTYERTNITASVDGLEHWLNPSPKALLRLLHRLPINSNGRAIWNLRQTLPHSVARDVMGQRGETEFRFTSSFRCYLLKFRFHG